MFSLLFEDLGMLFIFVIIKAFFSRIVAQLFDIGMQFLSLYLVPNVLSPRDLVSRPDIMDEIVPHTHTWY